MEFKGFKRQKFILDLYFKYKSVSAILKKGNQMGRNADVDTGGGFV
jgi:hypothetical protein